MIVVSWWQRRQERIEQKIDELRHQLHELKQMATNMERIIKQLDSAPPQPKKPKENRP